MKTAHLVKRYRALSTDKNTRSVNETSLTHTENEYLKPREAAEFLRIGYKRLLNMSSNGQIPYYKLGRSNLYLKSELNLMLEKSRRGPKV